jgi:hypothetical protein
MRKRISLVALPALLVAAGPGRVRGEGTPSNGFPGWAERVILAWTSRARCDPQVEMSACGSACGEAACYQPMAPLPHRDGLNRAARVHADEMRLQGCFAHDSACTVVSSIASLCPAARLGHERGSGTTSSPDPRRAAGPCAGRRGGGPGL